MKQLIFSTFLFLFSLSLIAEDGSRLWLRFSETNAQANVTVSSRNNRHASTDVARQELTDHWQGQPIELRIDRRLNHLKDGYQIKGNRDRITVSAAQEVGLLYGAYHLLRLQETGADISNLDVTEIPSFDVRILNHWDNLNRTIERGYAGHSLWLWNELPHTLSPRYQEYARANASIGINATVINSVNANPRILTDEYLEKVKALADVFRPYGVRMYLSVNFASPSVIGGLENSDPHNPDVQRWWKNKVNDIYKLIPDFGGFLVKANSEGQPGPHDYGRNHADGANMLADALQPHNGIVMWRAFVYEPEWGEDRASQAYNEFVPLDGEFRDNVIIQIKNGPIDFQPREPFSPLFGALRKTAGMLEFQITQEYLGFSYHLVFLAPQFKEALDSDTFSDGEGSTIAKITDGTLREQKVTAIAGVANIGEDANWCGHHFAQSNWYAFGRLAWNYNLSSEQIADEWIRMTFTDEPNFLEPVKDMMLTSWETAVNYMMPMGIHHIFAWNHHYGPEPWCYIPGARPDWLPRYYHNADTIGMGFDRTVTGSNNVAQYFPPLNEIFGNVNTVPEKFLLWFHHVPWDFKMKNGETMWDNLCYHYNEGMMQVRDYQKVWDRVGHYVDYERFRHVQSRLRTQSRDAIWWRDAVLLYFQTYSRRPIPFHLERPMNDLEDLKKIKLDWKHHN
ncbi:MAG: alpha-glucuronidase [Dysgonamonadaceae bacterium]|jgi:alpha-glucuronidase|nr:alpha-glucuronidase [Dysgonamonadaceae bacterium]